MRKVKNAIVGLGRIGSTLEEDWLREKPCTHAGVIAANPSCILVGGCDIDREKRHAFSKRWKCDALFSSVDEMLKRTRPDILHIATPPETHLEMVEMALRWHVRVAICEKPLAHTRLHAYRIARIHTSGRIKILTNHERRYSEDYRRVKLITQDRRYGELRSIIGKLSLEQQEPLTSILWNDGTHLIDAIHFLVSELDLDGDDVARRVRATAVHGDLSTAKGTCFIFGHTGAVPVMIEVGGGRDHLLFELDLGFSRGRVRIGNGLYEEYESGESHLYEQMKSLGQVEVLPEQPGMWPEGPTGYFTTMLEDALLCLRDKGKNPVSSAVHGYLALASIDESIIRSSAHPG
jgi:predicted dehydrogenase